MHTSPQRAATLFLLTTITALFTLTFAAATATAQSTSTTTVNLNRTFLAQGSLIAYAYPADTNDIPLRTAHFTLERHGDNNRWTLLFTNIQERTKFLDIVPMLDDSNVASVLYTAERTYTTRVLTWNLEKMKAPGAPAQIRTTFGNAFPKNMEPLEAAPWLMFCLPANLFTNGTNADSHHHRISNSVTVSNQIPNLFTTLAWPTNHIPCTLEWDKEKGYLRHGQFWQPGHGNIGMGSAGIKTVTLTPPHDKGYLGTTHQLLSEPAPREQKVTAQTPIRFQQNHYHVTPMPKPNQKVEPTITVIVQATITNLQSQALKSPSP